MAATIVGSFETRTDAEKAISDLRNAGYSEDDIILIAGDDNKITQIQTPDQSVEECAAVGAAAGAVATMALGCAMMTGAIPVIGPVLAAGPLVATLINAVGGGTVAGIAGALVGYGLSRTDADYCASEAMAGRHVVAVDWHDDDTPTDFANKYGVSRPELEALPEKT